MGVTGPYATGPDGQPMVPNTVQSSTSQPLSPSGLPLLPPGLMMPSPQDGGLYGAGTVPGLTPQITGDPVAQAIIRQQMRQAYDLSTHGQMMGGGIEQSFREIRVGMRELAASVQQAAAAITTAMRGVAPTQAGMPHPLDAPESITASQVSAGHAPTLEQMAPGVPEGPRPLSSLSPRDAFRSFSLADMGQRVAGHLAQGLQDAQAQSGWQQVEGEDTWVRWSGKGRQAVAEQAGPLRARVLNARANALTAAGAVARGESVGAALPGLGRVAGPVGFAAGGAMLGAHFLERQRDANRTYQQITGGDNFSLTNPTSGFRQRVGQMGFELSQFGVMQGEEARSLYLGTTAAGLQGGERQGALDFATQQFRKTGMDVADSLALIEASVRNGVTEFSSLTGALDKVSKTARETGQNVQTVQRAFANTLGTVQTQVTGGGSAPAIAAGIQQEVSKQGRLLGSQLDFTGMLSQPAMMMQASQLGMTPMAYAARSQEDPSLLGRGLQSQVDRVRDSVFGGSALQFAHGEAQRAMAATGGQLTSEDAAGIGRTMAERGMLNPTQFMAVAQAMGIGGVTPANVYEVAAKVALGGFRFDKALSTPQLPGGGSTIGGQRILTVRDQRQVKGGDSETARAIGGQQRQIAKELGAASVGDLSRAGQAYLGRVEGSTDAHMRVTDPGTGQRSAILEALLRDEKGLRDKSFVVQTKDGSKAVSFEEAFKSFEDQLSRGDVVIQQTGETVAQATGQMGDRGAAVTSSGKAAPKGAKDPGQAGVTGTVTIYATDELRRILGIVTSGGVSVDQARRQGVPAAPFPSTPYEYPNATGN